MERTTPLAQPLRLDAQGRLVIPARMREALGVQPGETIAAWIEGKKLVISSRRTVDEELRATFTHIEGSLADELIHERRAEARRELE